MRLANAKPKAPREQLRERWRQSRATAPTLATVFPQVESLKLDLRFSAQDAPVPALQSYVLHPPANAFFEYCCPHSACDGYFDLAGAVKSALGDSVGQRDGNIDCSGERIKDSTGKRPCGLRLHYTVAVQYRS